MKINKKSASECTKNTDKKGSCGCGTKHGSADEYEMEETEIKVSK